MSKFLAKIEEAYSQLNEAAPNPMKDINSIVGAIGTLETLYGKDGEPTTIAGKVAGFIPGTKANKIKELKKKLDSLRNTAGPILIKRIEQEIADLTKATNTPVPPPNTTQTI